MLTELKSIKGVGAARITALNDAGIFCLHDLVMSFPKKYIDMRQLSDIHAAQDGDEILIRATVTKKVTTVRARGMRISRTRVTSCQAEINLIWFNSFAASKLDEQTEYYYFGKLKRKGNILELINPIYERVDKAKHFGSIVPRYSVAKIPHATFSGIIKKALEVYEIESLIPQKTAQRLALMSLKDAILAVHYPKNTEEIEAARSRIVLEELSFLIAAYKLTSDTATITKPHCYQNTNQIFQEFLGVLPYELTGSQRAALREIEEDIQKPNPMNRILCGDVGSGKTIVAFAAMYVCARNGNQAVMLAPTEILAKQHYQNARRIFGSLGMEVCFLAASLKKSEHDEAKRKIADGSARLIFGTHALMQTGVSFSNLCMVVTDEQQRFGVAQRNALEQKSDAPDVLVMSATPIPRTIALTMYGDLQISNLTEKPQNRAEIQTNFVSSARLKDMFRFISDEAKKSNQAFIVCPRIEKSEDEDGLYSAEEMFARLSKNELKNVGVGLVHGRLTEQEKTEAMKKFQEGSLSVIVATTVVEVGVDIPNATIMAIFNAERFGLSQLHQLRGRVGRGSKQSYCFLITGDDLIPERLNIFPKTNDGFLLAERDFSERGAGDFIGTRQHGNGLVFDQATMQTAKEISKSILADSNSVAAVLKRQKTYKNSNIKEVTLN